MAWRDRGGGRDARQGRADPVRSAASLVDLQRDKEEAVQTGDFKERACPAWSQRPEVKILNRKPYLVGFIKTKNFGFVIFV